MKPHAELPPCPFCESIHLDYHVLKKLDGSKIGTLRYYDSHCVCCMMCGARIEAGSEAEVIVKWKRRAIEDALNAEVDRLARWVSDLQRGAYVNCVYCGHRYGPGETTPVSMADALKAHIEECPHHPMSAFKAGNERLRAELATLHSDIEAGRLAVARTGAPIQRYEHAQGLEDCDEAPYVECPECASKVWGVDLEDDPEYCPHYCDNCGLKFDVESARAALGAQDEQA